MGRSLPGSSVHGIFQARGLEWGAIAFSRVTAHGVTKESDMTEQLTFKHSSNELNSANSE